MMLVLLVASSQGFRIQDVGWTNRGLRMNKNSKAVLPCCCLLDTSACPTSSQEHPHGQRRQARPLCQGRFEIKFGLHDMAGKEVAERVVMHSVRRWPSCTAAQALTRPQQQQLLSSSWIETFLSGSLCVNRHRRELARFTGLTETTFSMR